MPTEISLFRSASLHALHARATRKCNPPKTMRLRTGAHARQTTSFSLTRCLFFGEFVNAVAKQRQEIARREALGSVEKFGSAQTEQNVPRCKCNGLSCSRKTFVHDGARRGLFLRFIDALSCVSNRSDSTSASHAKAAWLVSCGGALSRAFTTEKLPHWSCE